MVSATSTTIMGAVLELVFEVIVAIVGWILLHLILAPVIYIVATPLILVFALFGSGTYGQKVRSGYHAVRVFWLPSAA